MTRMSRSCPFSVNPDVVTLHRTLTSSSAPCVLESGTAPVGTSSRAHVQSRLRNLLSHLPPAQSLSKPQGQAGSTTPSPDFNPLHHLQEGVPTYKVKKSGAFIQVEVDVAYKQNYESNYWRGILDAQGKTGELGKLHYQPATVRNPPTPQPPQPQTAATIRRRLGLVRERPRFGAAPLILLSRR